MLHNTPRGVPNRLPFLTSSPVHVPQTILPLRRKARGAISEAHWIYGIVTMVVSLPFAPIIIPLQRIARGALSDAHWIYGTAISPYQYLSLATFPERTTPLETSTHAPNN